MAMSGDGQRLGRDPVGGAHPAVWLGADRADERAPPWAQLFAPPALNPGSYASPWQASDPPGDRSDGRVRASDASSPGG